MTDNGKRALACVVAALVLVNFGTFLTAIPETASVDGGCCAPNQLLAKDFSAYYTAAWRLFHDPSQLYFHGAVSDGETAIFPQPQGYKYLPSFLLLILPLLALPYGPALIEFDIFQFALLPAVAALIYYLLKGKGFAATAAVTALVLVVPFPMLGPQWSVSVSYYWQWAEGQCKVLGTFLLLSSLALAKSGRPRAAGAAFALAAFDPRFALLGVPLMLAYGGDLRKTVAYAVSVFVVANAVLFYPPTLLGFLTMVFTTGALTPPYPYAFIPLVALLLLIFANRGEVVSAIRRAREERFFLGRRPDSGA
ncbi:MAG: DUF2029 domain-containing protein [Nitrososphaerota archaeon]|nr:DUF2029 domain-containing protein [Nitrososphaerota archaeon]